MVYIEKHYSAHILQHSDELSRRALLHHEATDNVVTLAGALIMAKRDKLFSVAEWAPLGEAYARAKAALRSRQLA